MPAYAADTLDLSRLKVADIIPALSYEDGLVLFTQAFQRFWDAARVIDPTLPEYDVGGLESDPAQIVGQAASWVRLIERKAFDDRIRDLLLVSARGPALDLIGFTYYGVLRMRVAADPVAGTPEILELDDRYRARLQLAPEAGLPRSGLRTLGGPRLGAAKTLGGYRFHALSCDLRVRAADAASLARGEVAVVVLAEAGHDPEVVTARVRAWLMQEGVKGATDILTVRTAFVRTVDTKATLLALHGPSEGALTTASEANYRSFVAARGPFRAPLYLKAVDAALQGDGLGIETLIRLAPAEDVLAPFGTVISLGRVDLSVQRVGPSYG